MGTNVTYFDMAENDYQFLKFDYEQHRIGNIMCYVAQNVCERYLKHVIDVFCRSVDTTSVLRAHSLKILRRFIVNHISDFRCDWDIVMKADGYYFSARYPGDDSFIVDGTDVIVCWSAVEEVRSSVIDYLEHHSESRSSITKDILDALKAFDEKHH